jgi:hypothetical protein
VRYLYRYRSFLCISDLRLEFRIVLTVWYVFYFIVFVLPVLFSCKPSCCLLFLCNWVHHWFVYGIRVAQSLVLCVVCFVDHYLSYCPFTFGFILPFRQYGVLSYFHLTFICKVAWHKIELTLCDAYWKIWLFMIEIN